MLSRLVQPLNASPSIYVTLSGIVTFFKPLQEANALFSILVMKSGSVMLSRLVQPLNTSSSIYVTLSGIVICFNLSQEANAI